MEKSGRIDLTGKRFGRLIVTGFAEKRGKKTLCWDCKCDCGKTKIILGASLKNGATQSCGCYNREIATKKSTTHGLSKHPLYRVWKAVKRRCYNKDTDAYQNYGGRGIIICDEWRDDFQAFYGWAMANGYKEGLTIDRINNNGNYEPCNCRWITRKEQNNNTRRNVLIEYKGKTNTVTEWCTILNVKYAAVVRRLRRGWSIERALETETRG